MINTFKLVIAPALIVALAYALILPQALANHAWGKYHWGLSTADTIANPLILGDNLTNADWQARLLTTAVDWNQSVIKNQVATGTSNSNCDPVPGRVEVCNSEYGNNGWLGIAQVWTYRGKESHIAQAVTLLNDSYFNLPTYNTSAWRNLVMCQEVGHTFGLGHQDEDFNNSNLGSCMDYTNDPVGTSGNLNNERPNAHDYAMLETIYAHHNETTSGGGGKPDKGTGGGRGNKNTALSPTSWGQAVAQDAQGRNSVYVRNLDNGMQVITHVLWAPHTEHDHVH